jgi:Peptidase_C39 like family
MQRLRVSPGTTINVSLRLEDVGELIPMKFFKQCQDYWCWNACCQMLFSHYQIEKTQCQISSFYFDKNCCRDTPKCDELFSSECNHPVEPKDVFNKWLFELDIEENPLSFELVKKKIDKKKPVEVYYTYYNKGNHVAIITGYFQNGDLMVYDPLNRKGGRATYSRILKANNMGHWSKTYFNFRRQNGTH